eukprot:2753660-Pyramimonas_sp.AAC.1
MFPPFPGSLVQPVWRRDPRDGLIRNRNFLWRADVPPNGSKTAQESSKDAPRWPPLASRWPTTLPR